MVINVKIEQAVLTLFDKFANKSSLTLGLLYVNNDKYNSTEIEKPEKCASIYQT